MLAHMAEYQMVWRMVQSDKLIQALRVAIPLAQGSVISQDDTILANMF